MSTTYAEMVQKVRDWSNRDSTSLPDAIIQNSLQYAADTAYRSLMIPPLEHSTQYVITDAQTGGITNLPNGYHQANITNSASFSSRDLPSASLPVPGDLVQYIHIRIVGQVQRTAANPALITLNPDGTPVIENNRRPLAGSIFNEKTDIRTYYDDTAYKTRVNYWTRHGNNTLLTGYIGDSMVIELHYYRRLAALNALYTITSITDPTDSRLVPSTMGTAGAVQIPANSGNYFVGAEIPNWLRDENEKVVLFGALYHSFDFLGDMEEANRYGQKFQEAIAELNKEEMDRHASGGNVQVNYTSYLI